MSQNGVYEAQDIRRVERLSREEILAMEAGAKMDALVAKEVEGCHYIPEKVTEIYDWQPSSDIAAAWEVFQTMRGQIFSKRRKFMECLQQVVTGEREDGKLIAWPDVFWYVTPEAICKAALLAVIGGDPT